MITQSKLNLMDTVTKTIFNLNNKTKQTDELIVWIDERVKDPTLTTAELGKLTSAKVGAQKMLQSILDYREEIKEVLKANDNEAIFNGAVAMQPFMHYFN
jgi:hypothetical protein